MLEDAAFILGGSAAGRGPAERGHCTPDGPERPEEESCPSPAGSTGSWTARSVCMGLWEADRMRETVKDGREKEGYTCVRLAEKGL